jgi:hypothetical protein
MTRRNSAAFKWTACLIILGVFASLPVAAFAASHPPGPPTLAEFDADGDGFLTEEEFNQGRAKRHAAMAQEGRSMKGMATAPTFSDFDSNGDGRLDDAEFAAGHHQHMKAMHQMHGGMHHGMTMKMPGFEDLDLDGNGCIDAEEFAEHQKTHHGRYHGQPESQPEDQPEDQ